jgi:hypothetical protein
VGGYRNHEICGCNNAPQGAGLQFINDFDCQISLGAGLPTKVERLKTLLQTNFKKIFEAARRRAKSKWSNHKIIK